MIGIIFNKTIVIIYIIVLFSSISVFYTMFSNFKNEDILAKHAENIVKIGENLLEGGSFVYDAEISGTIETTNYTLTLKKEDAQMERNSFVKLKEKTLSFFGEVNISKKEGLVDIND